MLHANGRPSSMLQARHHILRISCRKLQAGRVQHKCHRLLKSVRQLKTDECKQGHTAIARSGQRRCVRVCAVDAPASVKPLKFGKGSVQEIPVFPLSLVAFPTADVPLNIFEARYRVLFNTLLAGSEGIVDDLVNPDKPWAGTRLFGICYITDKGNMASVGTTLHIQKHVCSQDGRMLLNSEGVEKFRVLKVLEQRPVMICQVEILDDEDDQSQDTIDLAQENMQLFKDFVTLTIKMRKLKGTGQMITEVEEMTPRQTSYWLGAVFQQNAYAQQALLEEVTVKGRLAQEKEVLESITKMLRAQLAVQSAFSSSESEESSSPPGPNPTKSEDDPTSGQQGEKQ